MLRYSEAWERWRPAGASDSADADVGVPNSQLLRVPQHDNFAHIAVSERRRTNDLLFVFLILLFSIH